MSYYLIMGSIFVKVSFQVDHYVLELGVVADVVGV